MTLIKICGITNLEDAILAAELGADILGFNFYKLSPRYIAPKAARDIIRRLDEDIRTVGVFVNEPLADMLQTTEIAQVGAIQLHGDETAEYVHRLREESDLKILKAFRLSDGFILDSIDECPIDAILLDSDSPGLYGGSGQTADWKMAKLIAAKHPKVYLAGGLHPENVASAVESVRPFAVDVASGVESAKGRKDPKKLAEFISNVKNV